jgi:hypothetical protein
MTFLASPKFTVATQPFSYPKSEFFFVLYQPFLRVSTKKKILIKLPTHVDARWIATTTPHPTQQQQQRIGCRSNNDPQRLMQSGEWQQSTKECTLTMGSTFDGDDHQDNKIIDHHDDERTTRPQEQACKKKDINQ